MPRAFAVVLAAVLSFAAAEVTPATDDHAWLIVVDDLHVPFAQTGRLRDLLRKVAAELIQDGDRFLFRASGPSSMSLTGSEFTSDRWLASDAARAMTGIALKDSDILVARSGISVVKEALYRANIALDAAEEAVYALSREAAPRQAIVYVSNGYDVDTYPALAERVRIFARRARENNITIFPIDARGFETLPLPDPRIGADTLQRYRTATRRSLSMIAEETGGFVIERPNEPGPGLKRIAEQMR